MTKHDLVVRISEETGIVQHDVLKVGGFARQWWL